MLLIVILSAAIAAVGTTIALKSLGVESAAAIGGGVGGAVGAVFGSSQSKKKRAD
jgi:hypothetical protein